MKLLPIGVAAAAMLASAACFAQTTSTTPNSTTGAAPMTPANSANRGDTNAASGDTNQAVATTSANASQPAHGANSFTMAQARTRMEENGYKNVTNLTKDSNGVWHGKADKNGATAMVWLDYKGNVGQGAPAQ